MISFSLKNKLISAFLAIITIIVFVPFHTNANESRGSYFNKNYKLTGNARDDIVAVAMAQVGKTKSDLKYTEEWCADFVCDCAQLAKLNFPFSGNCDTLLSMLKTRGGKWYSYNSSYQPQKGDIVFYSKYLNKSNDSTHV